MLHSADALYGYSLKAEDDTLGSVHDFYVDDREWCVRYLVAKTIAYIGRKVLLAPEALGTPRWPDATLTVQLTKDQIKASPPVDLREPVSKQRAREINAYYGWTVFEVQDHLRSLRELKGYHIAARDGDIGHVEDFILDTERWTIPHIVVDTRNLLPGKKVMLSPLSVVRVDWGHRSVYVDLPQQQVRESPQFSATEPVNELIQVVHKDYRGVTHAVETDSTP